MAINIGNAIPTPSTLGIVLIGVPLAIYLGGTRIGPIVNLSLLAVLVLQLVKPTTNPVSATSANSSITII